LRELDGCIDDYVLECVENVRAALRKKAEEAAAIRDWKPAAKFMEAEQLEKIFFGGIGKDLGGDVLTLEFPGFFGASDLMLSFHRAEGVWYVHDNGCALRHLAQQLKDDARFHQVTKMLCHESRIHNGAITGSFCQVSTFLRFLQSLVFVAHGDLFDTLVDGSLDSQEQGGCFPDPAQGECLQSEALLRELKSGIGFDYDRNLGLYFWLDTRYVDCSARAAFRVETLDDGQIRIRDKRKADADGAIFAHFYWDNEDLSPYSKFICNVAGRFGAEFDGQELYLTDNRGNFVSAAFRFFNLAMILSEFGNRICLPKSGQKG
jgi:hypothetical protein